jgi:hypothetical protein
VNELRVSRTNRSAPQVLSIQFPCFAANNQQKTCTYLPMYMSWASFYRQDNILLDHLTCFH